MRILVINSRIYSVEYELLEFPHEKIIARGRIDKIGDEGAIIDHIIEDREEEKIVRPVHSHEEAIGVIVEILTHPLFGVIKSKKEIDAVGHRVVHGGEDFHSSCLITKDVIEGIKRNIELAPLHNPFNLKAINASMKIFPNIPHVAVFDTSFYQRMPERAFYYALPLHLYKLYRIRRYGFHGIAHRYCLETVCKEMQVSSKRLKIISIYLGEGSSITAIKHGFPIDTSMGFTPLSGLVMTTRCGNIDPEIIIYLCKLGYKIVDVETLLHQESGILGVSGVSDNMKEVIEEAKKGDKRCKLAIELFVYSVRKYIFSYYGILEGVDVIVLTGGIGVNSPYIRERIFQNMGFIGLRIDKRKNEKVTGRIGRIDGGRSKVKVFIVPRNEGVLIGREVFRVVKGRKG
ncbi:MAG: acetate kinase [Caldiserica bacterium]|nr:MAG: acetate kinase [Caldisericota bacterium]